MPTVTDNLGLFQPDPGQSGVAAELNQNWSSLDGRFDEASGHTHDGTPAEGPKIPVTSIAATGTPSADTVLRGDGHWGTGGGGGAGVTDHGDLTGLTDDDHTNYFNQSRGDTRYTQRSNNLSDVSSASTARTNLGAAATVHQHDAADITSGTIATARLGSGSTDISKFLRADQTWAVPGAGGSVNLDDLADVLITAPVENQVLSYDAAGARWINEAVAGGGAVATDPIWDVAGDLAVGSGANTSVKLPKGSEGDYLTVAASGSLMWAKGGGTTAERPTGAQRVLYHRYFDTTLGTPITWNGTAWVACTTAPSGPAFVAGGLIFALAFDEGTGQTMAAVSPSTYGAVLGSTSSVEANDPDWVTQGLDFVPGNLDIVTAAGVPDTGWLGALTVMVVAKIDTGSAFRSFLNKHAGNGLTVSPITFGTQDDPTPLMLSTRANATGWMGFYGPTVTLGSYRCYSVTTADVGATPIFYRGTAATTGAFWNGSGSGAPTGSSAPVVIGRTLLSSLQGQMDGVISYVLVYSRALSGAEISTNYDVLKTIMAGRGVTLP